MEARRRKMPKPQRSKIGRFEQRQPREHTRLAATRRQPFSLTDRLKQFHRTYVSNNSPAIARTMASSLQQTQTLSVAERFVQNRSSTQVTRGYFSTTPHYRPRHDNVTHWQNNARWSAAVREHDNEHDVVDR